MIKTIDELKAQVQEKGITFWPIHNCSFCSYSCGYHFHGEDVFYDSGCDCVTYNNFQPRSWDDVAQVYNMNQPENNPKVSQDYLDRTDTVWQFNNELKAAPCTEQVK